MKYLSYLISCLLVLSCAQDSIVGSHRLAVGEAVPEFSVSTVDGVMVDRGSLLGKPSVIVLFDTRCPDCREELPEIERLWNTLEGLVNVIAVAREEKEDDIVSYWRAAGYTLPVAAPGNRSVYDLFDGHSMSGVPQTYVVNSDGVVVFYAGDDVFFIAEDLMSYCDVEP